MSGDLRPPYPSVAVALALAERSEQVHAPMPGERAAVTLAREVRRLRAVELAAYGALAADSPAELTRALGDLRLAMKGAGDQRVAAIAAVLAAARAYYLAGYLSSTGKGGELAFALDELDQVGGA